MCAKTKKGRFKLKRITDSKRSQAKLRALKGELMRRRHQPIPSKDAGSPASCAARQLLRRARNSEALHAFRYYATEHWYRALRRRSQHDRMTWKRMRYLRNRWLPWPQIVHPWPDDRFDARTQGRRPVR